MKQRQLFESNVVYLADFRPRREPQPADRGTSSAANARSRPMSGRTIAHQARMLAHLETVSNTARGK